MQPHAALVQRLRYFDRAEGADVAIVVSAFGNGVDMGTQDNGLESGVGAGSCADEVAGDVDAGPAAAFVLLVFRQFRSRIADSPNKFLFAKISSRFALPS